MRYVDYEILHTCQYPVEGVSRCEKEIDCGRPAPFRIYWIGEDSLEPISEMFVCGKHFDFIMKCEKNQGPG